MNISTKNRSLEILKFTSLLFFILYFTVNGYSTSNGYQVDTSQNITLNELNQKIGLHPAFEGGEAESLVIDCPLFEKKVEITAAEKVMENSYTGKLIVKEAKLIEK